MNLPYQLFVALRYLKSKKKQKGISVNTVISTGGVAVGVMALLVVLSVMSGFHEDLQRKILGVNAHIVILDYRGALQGYEGVIEKIKGDRDISASSPFVMGQVMVSYGKRAHGVFLRGISPELEKKTTDIERFMKEGSLESLIRQKEETPGIVIGKELAASIGVFKGDVITVLSPVGRIGPLGMLPKVRQFRVVGIFEVGMFEYDANLVLTDLRAAEEFFDMKNAVTGIQLRLADIYKAPAVREKLEKELGFPLYAKDWMQMNRNLFSALKLEKFAMFVILILIILVASFNIVSTLIMNVIEKKREIAILKTMGATDRSIMSIFMLQGLLIGLVGTVIGVTGGYLLCYVLNSSEIIKLPADVYYLSHLPVKTKFSDFLTVSLSAIVISFLATIYPAWQAAKMDPVEPLRYE
jgi:lipoprotein-releasing system permease protein